MPTYEYQAAEGEKGCPTCHLGFEVFHGMDEAPPTECPRCGGAIRKRFTAPGINTKWTKSLLSDDNLKRQGFTKLHNEGGGKFKATGAAADDLGH
jgi:putative FmdB family regulatory protein